VIEHDVDLVGILVQIQPVTLFYVLEQCQTLHRFEGMTEHFLLKKSKDVLHLFAQIHFNPGPDLAVQFQNTVLLFEEIHGPTELEDIGEAAIFIRVSQVDYDLLILFFGQKE